MSYATLCRLPGFSTRMGLLSAGRIAIVAGELSLIFAVHRQTGSLALSGTLAGIFALFYAIGTPLQGRLFDRYGQRVVQIGALVALPPWLVCAWSAYHDLPWLMLVSGAVWGLLSPNDDVSVQLYLTNVTSSASLRTTGFSLNDLSNNTAKLGGALIAGIAIAHPATLPAVLIATMSLWTVALIIFSVHARGVDLPVRHAVGTIDARVARLRNELALLRPPAALVPLLVALVFIKMTTGWFAILPLALQSSGLQGWHFSAAVAASAVGAITGVALVGIWAARIVPRARRLLLGIVLASALVWLGAVVVCLTAVWLSPLPLLAAGIGVGIANILVATLVLADRTDDVGRRAALARTASVLGTACGAYLAGFVGAHFGLGPLAATPIILCLMAGAILAASALRTRS